MSKMRTAASLFILLLTSFGAFSCSSETEEAPTQDAIVESEPEVDTADAEPDAEPDAVSDEAETTETGTTETEVTEDSDPQTACTRETLAEDCPEGHGCVDGRCAPCVERSHCAEGRVCADGVCGPCGESEECGGALCVDWTCRDCVTDEQCRSHYSDAHRCEAGACVARSCVDDTGCRLYNEICLDHLCRPCEDSYQCINSPSYGPGYQCLNGHCAEGECLTHANCSYDRPICGSNYTCRGCQEHAECLERMEAEEGYVCDPVSGRCHDGDCLYNADCESNLCLGHRCTVCENSEQCGEGRICSQGACVQGECNIHADCHVTHLCVDRFCVQCGSDGECPERWICDENTGVCYEGDCIHHFECEDTGRCVLHHCRPCFDDEQCRDENDDFRVCDENGDAGPVGKCYRGDCVLREECPTLNCVDHICEQCTDDEVCGDGWVCDEATALRSSARPAAARPPWCS